MKFIAIVQFIGVGFIVLISLIIMLAGGALFAKLGAAGEGMAGLGGGIFTLMGFFYLIPAAIMFFPALYLYRTAVNYSNFVNSESAIDLEEALEQQKNYWRFLGISTAIFLGFYAVMIFISIIANVALLAGR
jgi:hypothetical protein